MTNDEKNELKNSVKVFGLEIEYVREKIFDTNENFRMDDDLILHFFNEVKLILDKMLNKL